MVPIESSRGFLPSVSTLIHVDPNDPSSILFYLDFQSLLIKGASTTET